MQNDFFASDFIQHCSKLVIEGSNYVNLYPSGYLVWVHEEVIFHRFYTFLGVIYWEYILNTIIYIQVNKCFSLWFFISHIISMWYGITCTSFKPLQHSSWSLSSRQLLKTLWQKYKLLMMSCFSFCHSVLNSFCRTYTSWFKGCTYCCSSVFICLVQISCMLEKVNNFNMSQNVFFIANILYKFVNIFHTIIFILKKSR